MNNPIKFGTDGWRAVIANEFTFGNVRICSQAVADYLKRNNLALKGVVIGYDTRFESEDFAAASAEVLSGNGIKVYLCPSASPTPVVSYGVAFKKAGGAIIITASHNPGEYNGFKVKSPDGASAPTEAIAEIEKSINLIYPAGKVNRIELGEARKYGLLEDYDISPDYYNKIQLLIDIEKIKQAGLRIVVDSMYGAGSGYLKKILNGGTIKIEQINAERNPSFPGIQPEPIAHNLHKLSVACQVPEGDYRHRYRWGCRPAGNSRRKRRIFNPIAGFCTACLLYACCTKRAWADCKNHNHNQYAR